MSTIGISIRKKGMAAHGWIIAAIRAARRFVRRHSGEIAYYGGVLLVLGAIAWTAESYRSGRVEEQALVLPAVELEVAAEPEPMVVVPQGMEILDGYSEAPRWNRALGCWQSHAAVDYACTDGRIVSLSEGRVRTVGESGVLGGFVEIETGEYLLRYASAEVDEDIRPGMQLQPGDEIGMANAGMPSEAHLGAHLHLEVFRGNEAVNPVELQTNN